MRRHQLAGGMTCALGAAIIANALLGPLVLGVIRFRESASMETQLLGGEVTSLVLAGPLAIVAGVSWWRGHRLAPALALGPLGFALYTYMQFVLVPDYARYDGNNEQWFPLYLLMILASWIVGAEAWRELKATPPVPPQPFTARALGLLLVAVNGLFAVAWWASIAAILVRGPTVEYREHATAFWLVRLMDLGFVIPIGMLTGMGLLGRRPWSSRAAYAFAGTQTLLACSVAGMAVRMWLADDPSVSVELLVGSVMGAVGFLVLYGSLIGRALMVANRIALIVQLASSHSGRPSRNRSQAGQVPGRQAVGARNDGRVARRRSAAGVG